MIRDPFHQAIVARLNGRVDPESFERCAADLLRSVYPGLAPVRGGSDAGMDGAISDGQGAAYPLICTTSPDVIGNVRGSLRSYIAESGTRRHVVVATSQELTPRRRRNLEKAALEQGFSLLQIHDQAAFADLLYRSPEWCRELLGLSGEPPALSALPLTSQPLLGRSIIGRDADLAWLSAQAGDVLLVGQPGAGKSFVLREWVARGHGLFLVSNDIGRVADAIRAQSPGAILVDDAHLQRDLLLRLAQLRAELGATFRLVATCWPGEAMEVAKTLGIPKTAVRTLELLTRREIADVIRACGIQGPKALLRELIHQAQGRPGLAVTLCHLCLRDGLEDLARAASLYDDVRTSFGQLVGSHATSILAGFAVGGEAGMNLEDVAQALGMPLLALRDAVTRLAAGGVLSERPNRALVVQPQALGHALVGQVFFGATPLPIHRFLEVSRDAAASTLALIGALGRGAPAPRILIEERLLSCRSDRPWRAYASLGGKEVEWVLSRRPDLLLGVAWSGLAHVPHHVIPLMLGLAIGDERALSSYPEHPLRILSDWVRSAIPGRGEAVERRRALLDAILAWYASSPSDPVVCIRALAAAFSPVFEDYEPDPVDDLNLFGLRGGLLLEELAELQSLWPRAALLLESCGIAEWQPLAHLIHEWIYPGMSTRRRVEPQVDQAMELFARRMVTDLLPLAEPHPGVQLRILRLAERLNWEVHVEVDPDFVVLFPEREHTEDPHATHEAEATRAMALAATWALEPPEVITRRLVCYAREAAFADVKWPDWTGPVCRQITASVGDPAGWGAQLVAVGGTEAMVRPFLQRAIREEIGAWEEFWELCHAAPSLKGMVALVTLAEPRAQEGRVARALGSLEGLEDTIQMECAFGKFPQSRLSHLLRHPCGSIAAHAAWGVWHAEPEGMVPEALREDWRRAVVQHSEEEYFLGLAFAADPSLAFDWLHHRIARDSHTHYGPTDPFASAASYLTHSQRRVLLQCVTAKTAPWSLVRDLVGRDPELYAVLLSMPKIRHLHLSVLEGVPDSEWIPLALMALEAGYSAESVAMAALGPLRQWEGEESEAWARWAEQFRPLASHPDVRVRQIGIAGREALEADRDRARREEREEAVFGRRY